MFYHTTAAPGRAVMSVEVTLHQAASDNVGAGHGVSAFCLTR